MPRGALASLLRRKLPNDLAAMASYFLVDTIVETVGDPLHTKATMVRGVPEGSPASPTSFNAYIDELAEAVIATSDGTLSNPANFFADDVVLMSRTREDMQDMLDTCTNWTARAGLKWSVRKCAAIAVEGIDRFPLWLAGEHLQFEDMLRIWGSKSVLKVSHTKLLLSDSGILCDVCHN